MRFIVALLLALSAADAAAAQTSKFGIPSTSGAGGTQLLTSTVAQLPTCDVSHLGILRAVVDAAVTPVYNAIVAGGGTVRVAVMCNGTNWVNQ
jgi:Mg/Co/Ni transporter MgtE